MNPLFYEDFISETLRDFYLRGASNVPGVSGLQHIGKSGGLENTQSLLFLVSLYQNLAPDLEKLLKQRMDDRRFIDERTKVLADYNKSLGLKVTDDDYHSVLGLEDHNGRIVWGPLQKNYWIKDQHQNIAALPDFLKGPHVTLFGPPENEKMCINAMNAYHRRLKDEPPIIEELLSTHSSVPKWGADDEDSKTPIRDDLISSGENLARCFDGSIKGSVESGNKRYELAKDKLSLPIKRFPGLALPCTFLYLNGCPLPLHHYDFALHFYRNWNRPEALVFYVPKLENEEEARYIKKMIVCAEGLIQKEFPQYQSGQVRLMIVLENPRAIFRTNEIMDELYPYFAGASLGWHDFLASTARLMKEDGHYRIPIKADPDIVIKYIKASHELLANVVGSRGGIKVGGMYGILPLNNDLMSDSFQMTIKGYIRDVITQMKRQLTGFWVAHPDFVRLGLALVEAWKFYESGNKKPLENLLKALLLPSNQKEILDFVNNPDVKSLDPQNPRYARSLIVADLLTSQIMPNNSPEEIRYNVFQSLQYLTDWLSGNGCVALPAVVGGVPVRVMDDLATAERSRWEVWHEIHHGRISVKEFVTIAFEELNFIRRDLSNEHKIVQVKWNEKTAKWYPIAFKIMLKLMTDSKPVEFATELLLPLTMEAIRNSADPWGLLSQIDSHKFSLEAELSRMHFYFECCGHQEWAHQMSRYPIPNFQLGQELMNKFSKADIIEAAKFHGNIGESQTVLDSLAKQEQELISKETQNIKSQLLELGDLYSKKFGMKFLISARGKSASEILQTLKQRMESPENKEIEEARGALWTIARKRMEAHPQFMFEKKIDKLRLSHKVMGAQISLALPNGNIQNLCFGEAEPGKSIDQNTLFEIASLSKSFASAFALDFFEHHGISLNEKVNNLLNKSLSKFRLKSHENSPPEWADEVTIKHLLNHEALNLHYVNGVPLSAKMPPIEKFLDGNSDYGYAPIRVISKPGSRFKYSGGGFIVLEHLIEAISGKSIFELSIPFTQKLGLRCFTFDQKNNPSENYAMGFSDQGNMIDSGRKMFPAFAAGAMSTSEEILKCLQQIGEAFHNPHKLSPISHDTAVNMLCGHDVGSVEFMGAKMGLGIFIHSAGPNKIAIHQGANNGFRALYLYCFDGPDYGMGISVLANADNKGVSFISEVTQEFLKNFPLKGVDTKKFRTQFVDSEFIQEEKVNRGFKELIFSAFEDTLPESIIDRGPRDPLSGYNKVIGAKILHCSNQSFARAENLISAHQPRFDPTLFGAQGKVMDSWESARHNVSGHEELILELSTPAPISFVCFSTAFHLGNHAPLVSLEAKASSNEDWYWLIDKCPLEGHSLKKIAIDRGLGKLFKYIRVKMYPDGGLSRLQIFDFTLPESEQKNYLCAAQALNFSYPEAIPQTIKPLSINLQTTDTFALKNWDRYSHSSDTINLASSDLGAKILSVSNEHFGSAQNVLSPLDPLNMFDGFESARSRDAGHREELLIELAKPGKIQRLEFDFRFFKNNNPMFVEVMGLSNEGWVKLVSQSETKAFAGLRKVFNLDNHKIISQLKVLVYPDGGINRIKAYAKI